MYTSLFSTSFLPFINGPSVFNVFRLSRHAARERVQICRLIISLPSGLSPHLGRLQLSRLIYELY